MKKFSTVKNIKYLLGFSAILIIISIIGLATGFNQGIDFKGGMLFQLKFENKALTADALENQVKTIVSGYGVTGSVKIQPSEDTFIIKTPYFDKDSSANEAKKKAFLEAVKAMGNYEVVQITVVGPTMGDELKGKAVNALIIAAIGILLYITMRFKFSYAMGGIVSLIHDIIIAAGFIAFFKLEIDSTFVAALLTILGYSINDTIVVYDRIRENENKHRELSLADNVDLSIRQVLGRSINTSMTVLFALITLYIFGGESLKTFTTTLLVGVSIGTYSSIFVATPVMYWLHNKTYKKSN